MRRRRGRALAAGLVGTLAIGLVGLAIWMTRSAEAGDRAAAAPTPETEEVQERTLRVVDDLSGTLGHGDERPISANRPGTVTALPDVGDTVDRGGTLFEVDAEPTVLLYGAMPAWRDLTAGISGRDVEQLEQNLVELGHGDNVTVDERWDAETTAALKPWQEAVGLDVDGSLELGEIVFEPDAVMVAGHDARRGATVGPGSPVIRATGTARVISASLSASQRDGVQVGETVEVEFGDGTRVDATVDEIDAVPATAQDGSQTYGMRLTLDESVDGARSGPVTLEVIRQERADVLAVPVSALVALLEGGYAVERLTEAGARELVSVEVGLFSDGWVEVRGDLAAGDRVVVP